MPHRGLRLRLATCAASHRDFRRRLSRRARTPPPRRTKTPASRASRNCWGPSLSPNLSSEAELLRRMSAPQSRAARWSAPTNRPFSVGRDHRARRNMWSLGMTTEKRGSDFCCFREASEGGVFVHREGGFRDPEPCQRPTGLSGGMPHGEGRRPSSRGGIPMRWTARSAGRQGFGCLW